MRGEADGSNLVCFIENEQTNASPRGYDNKFLSCFIRVYLRIHAQTEFIRERIDTERTFDARARLMGFGFASLS